MRFLGGFYVFPGGTIHAADCAESTLQRCRGLTGIEAQRLLGNQHEPVEALGHWVAVVRELFEEVGVLLCSDEHGAPLVHAASIDSHRIENARRSVVREISTSAHFYGWRIFSAISQGSCTSIIG
jgi:8-oxo-dGTP pyrophosphatase MutT (NUDIX family)